MTLKGGPSKPVSRITGLLNEKDGTHRLRIKIKNELLPLALLVMALMVVTAFSPADIPRMVLGLPFMLFCPGYALIASLFPRREGLGSMERVVLSFVLSMAVVPLLGLILNFTPLGIRLESVLYATASFTLIISAMAWFRRRGLPKEERFGVEFHLARRGTGTQNKALSIILALVILGVLGMMIYAIAAPKAGESFTEFYLLGPEGKAENYPGVLNQGEPAKLILGIVNHEDEATTYRIEVTMAGEKVQELGPMTLANEERWEQEVNLAPEKTTRHQKVEFLLYKGTGKDIYHELNFWIDVVARKEA
jgi:uncharacterized membrane protein